ncbi:MAG: hypothetical protein HRT83_02680 [Hyphomicrobiaceae bacterium]|nr:hypothetical protein [Hyphomicrobiaceae bacterium]
MLTCLTVVLAAAPGVAQTGLPQFNVPDMAPQLIWLALTFGFMYLVLSRTTLPSIASVIEERQTHIQRDLDNAERLKVEADQALVVYEQKLAQAHARAKIIVTESQERVAAEVSEGHSKSEVDLARQMSEAQERIGLAKTRAVHHIDAIVVEMVGEIITRLADVDVSDAEIDMAIAMQQSLATE